MPVAIDQGFVCHSRIMRKIGYQSANVAENLRPQLPGKVEKPAIRHQLAAKLRKRLICNILYPDYLPPIHLRRLVKPSPALNFTS
jgi:hypothetical protein